MQESLPSRTVLNLSDSFRHNLRTHTLAAVVFVGFLCFVKPTHARVVYTKTDATLSGDGQLNLDLNHDGKPDFAIVQHSTLIKCADGSYSTWFDVLVDSRYGSVVGHDDYYASALNRGVSIDSSQTFFGVEARMLIFNNCPPPQHFGDWYQVTDRFLGLQDANRYGWAQLSVSVFCQNSICRSTTKLSGFAFETVSGRAIKTGQTKDDLEIDPDSANADNAGSGASITNPTPDSQPVLGVEGIPLWRQKNSVGFTK